MNSKKVKITKEIASQMKDSGIDSLVSLAKEHYPELFYPVWDRGITEYNMFLFKKGSANRIGDKKHVSCSIFGNDCELDIPYIKLCLEMRAYNRWINKQDDFTYNFNDGQRRYIITICEENIKSGYTYRGNVGLFNCHFKSEERVVECVDIFQEDIEKVFGLTR